MEKKDQKLVEKCKAISRKGLSAEVKQDREGNWIVYEVKKNKYKVE